MKKIRHIYFDIFVIMFLNILYIYSLLYIDLYTNDKFLKPSLDPKSIFGLKIMKSRDF